MKRVLFIAPLFFGYWEKIKNVFESYDMEVYFINQSLSKVNIKYRIIDRLSSKRVRDRQNIRYYSLKIQDVPDDIDYVVVIRGDSLNIEIMHLMHKRFKSAKFVMYQWDSIKMNPVGYEIKDSFDEIYTFDPIDAKEFNWKYRPLFFDEKDCNINVDKDIDIAYFCTLKFKRAQLYKELKLIANRKKLKMFSYLFVDKLTFLKRKYINHDPLYSAISTSEVNYKAMPLKETSKIYDRSRVIVDYTTSEQTGLSMRSIESIGHACKLVTNNVFVKEEPFYCKENVFIYDENNFELPDEFIAAPYKNLNTDLYNYYSLNGWIKTILGME